MTGQNDRIEAPRGGEANKGKKTTHSVGKVLEYVTNLERLIKTVVEARLVELKDFLSNHNSVFLPRAEKSTALHCK